MAEALCLGRNASASFAEVARTIAEFVPIAKNCGARGADRRAAAAVADRIDGPDATTLLRG